MKRRRLASAWKKSWSSWSKFPRTLQTTWRRTPERDS